MKIRMKQPSSRLGTAIGASLGEACTDCGRDGLDATPAYWFSMFAASALGTNLGDFWVDGLSSDRTTSFGTLAIISGLAVWLDRRIRLRAAVFYWIAIVTLRAAATNVGDFLTHDLGLSYSGVSIALAVATLIAASFTEADTRKSGMPDTDTRYWIAMFIAGIFGTVSGDLASHLFGLYAAAGSLCLVLLGVLFVRGEVVPTSVMAYWIVVLTERCAGTPAGDALASNRAVGLGLPLAMMCTGGLLMLGLLGCYWPLRSPRRRRLAADAPVP